MALSEKSRGEREAEPAGQPEAGVAAATAQEFLDALPGYAALVDAHGWVRARSANWPCAAGSAPAARRPPAAAVLAVGESPGRAQADQAGAGLRAVLAGSQSRFALDYECSEGGTSRWYRLTVTPLGGASPTGTPEAALILHQDVTEQKVAELERLRLAYEDPVTGAFVRYGFATALATQKAGAHPGSQLIVLDLNGLRDVNDVQGYAAGDALLAAVAARLRAQLGEAALLGRTSGDTFLVFVPAERGFGPTAIRRAVAEVFAAPFHAGGLQLKMGARFGYTRLGRPVPAAAELLRQAELALYQSSTAPGHNWRQFTRSLDRAAHARIARTDELRKALARDEFELHFQPKIAVATGEVTACEALVRWNHPRDGLLQPGAFMATAEQSQLIAPLGDWVLGEACRCLAGWQADGLQVVRVAVNVSPVQLAAGGFAAGVQRSLARWGIAPNHLTVELTEGVLLHDSPAMRSELETLHALGVQLALDDFGTGYSSLSYLQRYPFDEIKIDKAFVQAMTAESYSTTIVEAVLAVAGALNATGVAEGVERVDQRDALRALGCPQAQGFYYSLPLAAEDFRWLLAHRRPLPLAG